MEEERRQGVLKTSKRRSGDKIVFLPSAVRVEAVVEGQRQPVQRQCVHLETILEVLCFSWMVHRYKMYTSLIYLDKLYPLNSHCPIPPV